MSETRRPPRRVVTGHDANGKSIIMSDGPPANILNRNRGIEYFEMWRTTASPQPISATEPEPTYDYVQVCPEPGGTAFRVNEMLPGHYLKLEPRADGRYPGMHRTETIDLAICLEGECWAMLDDSETLMRAGDVLIQRGTDHAWQNRSDKPVRMAYVIIDGAFSPELKALLPGHVELMA